MKSRSTSPNRIILAADSHGLSHFTDCPMKYWLGNVQHLRQIKIRYDGLKLIKGADGIHRLKPVEKYGAKELGTFIHDMIFRVQRLRLRYIKNKVPLRYKVTDTSLIQVAFKRIAIRAKLGGFEKPQEDILFHQMKFMEFFSMLKVNNAWLKPIGNEVGFSKVLYEDRDVCFIYEGRVDHIGRSEPANILSWVDYKSQSRESALYENTNQFLGYSWVLGTNIGFVQYYGLQKEKPKEQAFRLKPIYHNPALIEQWKKDTIHQFFKIASIIPFGESAFERVRSSCNSGKYSDCQFIRICDNAWAGSEVISGIKRTFYKIQPWHPWKSEPEEVEKQNE